MRSDLFLIDVGADLVLQPVSNDLIVFFKHRITHFGKRGWQQRDIKLKEVKSGITRWKQRRTNRLKQVI